MIFTFRSSPPSLVELLFLLIVAAFFILIGRRIYKNRRTGFYFILRVTDRTRVGIEDGSVPLDFLLKKYDKNAIVYITPEKALFYAVCFILPALFIVFTFFFELRTI